MSFSIDIAAAVVEEEGAEGAAATVATPTTTGTVGSGGGGAAEAAATTTAAAAAAATATGRETNATGTSVTQSSSSSPSSSSSSSSSAAAASAASATAAALSGPCDVVVDGLVILMQQRLLSYLSVPDQLRLKQTCRFLHAEVAQRVDVRPTSVVLQSPVVEQLLALNDTLMEEFYDQLSKADEGENDGLDEDALWDMMHATEYPQISQLLENVLRAPITDSGHGVVRTQSPLLLERERLHLMALIDRLAASHAEPDFHPGSNGVVLDIVHPALFCYVEGESRFVPSELLHETAAQRAARLLVQIQAQDDRTAVETEGGGAGEPRPSETPGFVARALRWGLRSVGLGLDAEAQPQTEQAQTEQPKREELLREDMWGRPFEDSKYQWLPTYFDVAPDGVTRIEDYINGIPRRENQELYANLAKLFSRALPLLEQAWTYCKTARFMSQRLEGMHDDPAGYFNWGDFEESTKAVVHDQFVPLRGRRLQVITKIVDYCLKPGESYEGAWHVEGMSHENIVATSVYVIDRSPALQGGELRFKRAFSADEGAFIGYNVSQDRVGHFDRVVEDGLLPVGSMLTPHNHLIVFPNSHVHKVARLSNEGSQPARRRIVVFFLVNPERRIVSTKEVPNQRAGKPPAMSLAQAKAHRLALMHERKHHKQDFNVRTIELCEH